MGIEKAGEPVFTNIDKVLTEKIISRSKENSRESEPVSKQVVNENNTVKPVRLKSSSPIKWAAIAAGFALLVVLILSRKNSKDA
ncbi:MAG: hypothetical protein FWE57_06650 [Chitinispirillia bacterium]|nr:hypothetical protein [Chitinispirillia bacterium]